MRFAIILKILFLLLAGGIGVQANADTIADTVPVARDTLSAAARSDSAAAAFKVEALRQVLGGDSYQPTPPVMDNFQAPDFGRVATRMTVGLLVILALLYVIYVLLKKVRKVESVASSSGQSLVKLLDSKFLGAGKSVLLIKVGVERVLVVGSYTDGMRTLSEIQGEEAKYILETYDAKPVTAAQFSATVDHLLRRFKREGGR
ncbi:MAG: flagellar biosynthetic protein FliO [Fibromonadaceae bacterium]|jgi:flagellar biogenesis protein FliO|nr:flagellar biosynthetic protein FliO [Fibromonadaceae bacterium]